MLIFGVNILSGIPNNVLKEKNLVSKVISYVFYCFFNFLMYSFVFFLCVVSHLFVSCFLASQLNIINIYSNIENIIICICLVNNLAYIHDSYTIHPILCYFMCYNMGKFTFWCAHDCKIPRCARTVGPNLLYLVSNDV